MLGRFLLNPLLLLGVVAQSSAPIEALFILAFIYMATRSRPVLAATCLGVACQLSVYNVYHSVPLVLMLKRSRVAVPSLLLVSLALTYISARVIANASVADYLMCTVGCSLFVSDLRPNIGLWWYPMVEMFEHFRPLFLAVFQLLPPGLILPGAVRFRGDPVFLLFYTAACLAVLKPYPTASDIGLGLQLLLLKPLLVKRMAGMLTTLAALGVAVGYLLTVVWYYWMVQGSGNSNFYYAATLGANMLQMALVVGVVAEHFKMALASDNPKLAADPEAKFFQR